MRTYKVGNFYNQYVDVTTNVQVITVRRYNLVDNWRKKRTIYKSYVVSVSTILTY